MSSLDPGDDDDLLADLRSALPERALSEKVSRAGKGAYAWRTIDGELASLAYDSAVDGAGAGSGARSEAASVRTLTFESGSLLVELGVADERVVGQLVPPRSYRMALHRVGRDPVGVPVDDLGCFSIETVPRGAFSLRIVTPEGVTVTTGWVTL